MIVLVVVLFVLSRPATLDTPQVKGQAGGVLAQYRDDPKHNLSQTELGEIDPTSETIRLATLGMRGIAGTTLWWKATQYQMKKDWTRLRASLDQISKLQPHSIDVLALPGLEPFLQRLRGLRRLSRQVLLGDRGPELHA